MQAWQEAVEREGPLVERRAREHPGEAPHRCRICTGTGLTPPTSAPGRGSPSSCVPAAHSYSSELRAAHTVRGSGSPFHAEAEPQARDAAERARDENPRADAHAQPADGAAPRRVRTRSRAWLCSSPRLRRVVRVRNGHLSPVVASRDRRRFVGRGVASRVAGASTRQLSRSQFLIAARTD